jgi:ammonia channel protein AmtB
MSLIRRKKKKWQRVVEKVVAGAADSQAAKAGAGALAGLVTLTAASAAVSSVRRKSQS